ncbi:M14 family zinc carboxypeptidase [Inhella sp.]|uniref:M14 family zinc carboxypeptidase n=1 Tax=Inhella sp. TaxID=1921806 RepID=UPI0035B156C1
MKPLLSPLAAALLAGFASSVLAGPGHSYASSPEMVQLRAEELRRTAQVFEVHHPRAEMRRKASITFHAQLLETADEHLVMELTTAEQAELRGFGFQLKPAKDFIARRDAVLNELQRRAAAGLDASVQSIPSYSCYETVEESFAAAQGMATAKPALASWIDVGDSWQKTQGSGGYDIRVLKLTNSAVAAPAGGKPKLFINAAIHAREYATAPLALAFARWLFDGHGVDADATWILDHHEVHFLLQTNPDGRKKAEGGLSWRKNANNSYCANTNTRGADLNRNFSYGWNTTNGQGSSGSACNETYRGPSAGSEPETQAIQAYVRSIFPDRRGPNKSDAAPADTPGIHLDIHSYSRLVLWPWGDVSTPAPNGTALQTLGRKFAFHNGYTPQQSVGLYPTDGTSDGVSYGELGVAAYTFELGTAFFESCTSFNNTIKPGNLPALIYAAKVVRTPYITPAGPDITSLALGQGASGGGVQPGVAVTLTAAASDARFNSSNGTEATQAIAAAEYYIDVPPWQSGAVAQPIQAADGSFNSVSENLTATIPTGTLPVGRHTVFVRARDASGAWGAFSAAFLNISNGTPALDANFFAQCNGLSCSFDASSSTGSPSSYQWTFGDGGSGSGVSIGRTYAAAGTYNVTLTVGNGSSTNSETKAVVVTNPSTIVNEVESNNTIGTATMVSPPQAIVPGSLSTTSDTDYFAVPLPAGATLKATLTPPSSGVDYDLYIVNSSGTTLASSTKGAGQVDVASSTNTGSTQVTRYVRVRYYSGGAGSYSLKIER